MKHGKNYVASASLVERSKIYEPKEALALAIDTAKAKFDETIELHVKLGVDPEIASDDACRIEHDISPESFDALKKHFGEHI